MGDFVIQVYSRNLQFCHNLNCFSLGVWAVYVAGGDILGVILAQQRGHLRQDFFRWVKKLSEAGKRLAKLIPACPPRTACHQINNSVLELMQCLAGKLSI